MQKAWESDGKGGTIEVEIENAILPDGQTEQQLSFEDFVKSKIEVLDTTVREYVYSKYPQHRQLSLTKLQTDARLAGKTEAAAYLDTCWAWMQSVFTFYYSKEDEIMVIANDVVLSESEKRVLIVDIVNSLDLSQFDVTDPKVTIRNAMGLLQSLIEDYPNK